MLNKQYTSLFSEGLQSPTVKLNAILYSTPNGLLLIDNDYNILEFNSLMEDFVKIAWLKPLQKNESLLNCLPTEKIEAFRECYRLVLQGDNINYLVAYPSDDSCTSSFDMNLNPIFDSDGTVIGCCISSEDISIEVESGIKLSKLNAALERKVSERTAQYEAVNKELEALTYSVSHDLRTPLRAVSSYAQILLEDYEKKLDEDGLKIVESIRYNGEKMGRLIDELLVFSKLGRKEVEKEVVSMDDLTKRVIADLG